jgi:AraC family L-rhamnose operon transcriptional activator RhaR
VDTLYQYRREELFGERGDAILVQRVAAHRPSPPHGHEFIEVVLTVGGTAQQRTTQHCLPVRRGTLTILRPGHWHSYEQPRGLAIYNCCFGPELLRRELAWLIDNPMLTSLLWGSGEMRGRIGPPMFQLPPGAVKSLQDILEGFESCRDSGYDIKISWLCLFLTTLAEILQKQVQPGGEKNRLMSWW